MTMTMTMTMRGSKNVTNVTVGAKMMGKKVNIPKFKYHRYHRYHGEVVKTLQTLEKAWKWSESIENPMGRVYKWDITGIAQISLEMAFKGLKRLILQYIMNFDVP